MGFSLTKTIPSRKETISFNWIIKDFFNYGAFRKARERMGLTVWKQCYWCRKSFSDEDMMALGSIQGKGNKPFCQDCVEGSE